MTVSKTAARAALFLVTAFVLVVFYLPLGHDDYAGHWGDGTFGLHVRGAVSNQIDRVAPGSPAERAGIHAGDAIVGGPFSKDVLQALNPHADDVRTFAIRRPDGSVSRVTMRATPVPLFSTWDRVTGILAILPATVFLIVAFALVFLRPSVMTWSFYGVAAGYFSTGPSYQYFSSVLPLPALLVLTFILSTFFGNFAVLPLLPFLMRFPDDRLTGFSRIFDRLVWTLIVAAFVAYCCEWYYTRIHGMAPNYGPVLDVWLPLATFAAATYVIVGKNKHATPATRQRFGFLAIGMVISFVAYAVYFVPGLSVSAKQLIGYAVVFMPVCVAYAVLRHRVLDVNFVLNRALAYGILSVFVIALVSALDWLSSRVLSEWHLAVFAEFGATIAVGFLLDRINRAVEAFVERVFFRRRREAEHYLKRAASALPYATKESAVAEGLVEVPSEALRLSAAALYRKGESDRFDGVATSAITPVAPPGFDANHLLVRMLQSEERCVWLEALRSHLDSENSAIYVLAMPVTVRHELVSFTLYGAHANGAQLDPEEVEMLEDLVREAARAYDHIEAVRMRERYSALSGRALAESV